MQQEIKCNEKHLVGYVDILGTKDVIKKKSRGCFGRVS